MHDLITLNQLKIGEKGRIHALQLEPTLHHRFVDLGLIPNTIIECVGKSPHNDPCAYLIRGAIIALRQKDCANIQLYPLKELPQ